LKSLDKGICSIDEIETAGIKKGEKGLALIKINSDKSCMTGVFTKNKIKAAPVRLTSEILSNGKNSEIKYILVNSGCANAFTGEKGYEDAQWMSSLPSEESVVCSTGAIGTRVNRKWIKTAYKELSSSLESTKKSSKDAAKAIMTTDTFPKEISFEFDDFKIAGIAKGAGMIEPNMGTMLAFIFTNASISKEKLKYSLRDVVDKTFNMVTVDGDTSTNDTVLLSSTKSSTSEVNYEEFKEALEYVCRELSKMIARDGEGSSKFIEMTVSGAKNELGARDAVKSVLRSPLVKSAIYGEDPNIGRIIAALGKSSASFDEEDIKIDINNIRVVNKGRINNLHEVKDKMKNDSIEIQVSLGSGNYEANGWGCDLSPEYVQINSGYMS